MKTLKLVIISLFVLGALFTFKNCTSKTEISAKEATENILKSKTWAVSSVNVPVNTATESADWVDFTVSFGASMTCAEWPTGASAVWPSGSYEVNDGGNQVTRGDGVVMTLTSISETGFTSSFDVPVGTEIGGRIAALDGGYTFIMK